MNMNKKIILIGVIILLIAGLVWGVRFFAEKHGTNEEVAEEAAKKDRIETIEITNGSTFGKLMTDFSDLDANTVNGIYKAAQPVYDLAKIRVGRFLELVYDADTGQFKEFRYKIDSEDQLRVYPNPEHQPLELKVLDKAVPNAQAADNSPIAEEPAEMENAEAEPALPLEDYWRAVIEPIPYETRVKVAEGTVETSLYEAAMKNGVDERAIIELANVFQWTLDFAMDPRVGDTFKFVYEERYLDGEYVMPGRVLAGEYVNAGTVFDHYYFEESEDNKGYFDGDGNSVQKMFLKAPVEFRYISSGYTTGTRVVMEVGLIGPHMAIDYAAASGTPIRAVGDGVVTQAGRSGCYGNMVTVRHNGTYTTRYAHQSKMAAKVGQRVKQGEIIGYVGSTGCSTGPHLHFEMIKNGTKIDPLKEILPPGQPIQEENRQRFAEEKAKYRQLLGLD